MPTIEERIEELQAEWEALGVAVSRVLAEKAEFVEKHRGRLAKEADRYADEAHGRYLELVDQLEAARDDLRLARRAAVWARLYPSETAAAESPDTLAGGRKRALAPLGVSAPVATGRVLDALREDARYLSEAATPEQTLIIAGRDPREPPNTEWVNDPEAKAERARRMAEWAARP